MPVLAGPTYNMDMSASASSPAENNKNICRSDESRESSSIGTPGDSEEEEEEEEENDDVSSRKKDVGLQIPRNKFSMDSLEDSLPSKRSGLSNHYSGKSKSFANLTEVMSVSTAVKDLEKQENPFNKRRRLLIANRWSRKLFYSRHNPKSMPLLPVLPDDVEQQQNSDEYIDDHKDQHDQVTSKQDLHVNKLKVQMGFKSQSCFCLADLAEEEEEEEED